MAIYYASTAVLPHIEYLIIVLWKNKSSIVLSRKTLLEDWAGYFSDN